jgi:hypothetical protein
MDKKLKDQIDILSCTPDTVSSLIFGFNDDLIYANEGNDTWSPHDIIGHLIHGEKTDWIPRAKIILEHGESKPFQPFDRFAQKKDSVGKTIDELLDDFTDLRNTNIKVLTGLNLKDDDYTKTGIHPEFGKVTLSQLISTWVVHDLNHIAQISRVVSSQFHNDVGPWKKYLRILNG